MNNCEYQGEQEPVECPECFSSMTEVDGTDLLQCDNTRCGEYLER